MYCANCGSPLPEGAKFCPACGNPVPQDILTPETPAAPEVPVAPPPPAAPATPPTPSGVSQNNMLLILRIVCGILGAVFAFFALRGAFYFLRFLFGTVANLRYMLPHFGFVGYIVSTVVNLLFYLLDVLIPALAAAVLLLTAIAWKKEHNDLLLGSLAAAAVLRLLRLVLIFPCNLLLSILYRGAVYTNWRYIGSSLLHVLGYAATAGIVFLLLYLMGCPPFVGETPEQVKENVRNSFATLTDSFKKAAPAAPATEKTAPPPAVPAVPPAAPPSSAPVYSRRMKTDRSLLMYILLNFITCGIYSYIFIYNLSNDANQVCDGDGQKTAGLLPFLLLSWVTCGIYSLIWWYKLCDRMAANAPRYGLTFQENGTTFLLWSILGSLLCGIGPFIALHFVLRNMNALCAGYNQQNGLYN